MNRRFTAIAAATVPSEIVLSDGIAALDRYIGREAGKKIRPSRTRPVKQEVVVVTVADLAEDAFAGVDMEWVYKNQGKTLAQVITVLAVTSPKTIGEDWNRLKAYAELIIGTHAGKSANVSTLYDGLRWVVTPRLERLIQLYDSGAPALTA